MEMKGCVHLEGMCAKGCYFSGEEKTCPKYEAEGRLKIRYISVDLIDARPGNRDIGDVSELAESIRAEGIHTPLNVVPHIEGIEGRFTAVAGHRRLAAAKVAGLTEVPCIVRELDEAERITMMITENTQRKAMTPLEEAEAIGQLMMAMPEGTTTADVARRTGLSETTVRRRRKLAELPPELVRQADQRGARLEDYEKLNAIRDPGRKAKVLAAMGTAEFDRELQHALNREEDQKGYERLLKSLEKKGAKRLTDAEAAVRRDLKVAQTIYSWQFKTASIGKMARDEEWFYAADGNTIRVYRAQKPEAEGAEKSDAEKAREELAELQRGAQERLAGIDAELSQMEQDFLDLREKFIEGFDTCQRNREEIMEFAVRAMIHGCYWSDARKEELREWLGVDPDDSEALGRTIRGNPERMLLLTAYCLMEKDAYAWVTRTYDIPAAARVVKHQEGKRMDRLYEGLALLGYGMSTDEKRMQSGDMPQFGQAQRLVDSFKAAKKGLDKRINA